MHGINISLQKWLPQIKITRFSILNPSQSLTDQKKVVAGVLDNPHLLRGLSTHLWAKQISFLPASCTSSLPPIFLCHVHPPHDVLLWPQQGGFSEIESPPRRPAFCIASPLTATCWHRSTEVFNFTEIDNWSKQIAVLLCLHVGSCCALLCLACLLAQINAIHSIVGSQLLQVAGVKVEEHLKELALLLQTAVVFSACTPASQRKWLLWGFLERQLHICVFTWPAFTWPGTKNFEVVTVNVVFCSTLSAAKMPAVAALSGLGGSEDIGSTLFLRLSKSTNFSFLKRLWVTGLGPRREVTMTDVGNEVGGMGFDPSKITKWLVVFSNSTSSAFSFCCVSTFKGIWMLAMMFSLSWTSVIWKCWQEMLCPLLLPRRADVLEALRSSTLTTVLLLHGWCM